MNKTLPVITKSSKAFTKKKPLQLDENRKKYEAVVLRLSSYIKDTQLYLNEELAKGKNILLEGAQGTMLDIDHGTYPFVTSSSTTSGGACTGSGISPIKINHIIGATKAYTTRVGSGIFPTELCNEEGENLRQKGNEFGATTGRPRRTGWLDLVALRYTTIINGVTEIAILKLDVLNDLREVKACVAYKIDGKEIEDLPLHIQNYLE